VSQSVKDCHVKFVVLFGSKTAGPELRYQGRTAIRETGQHEIRINKLRSRRISRYKPNDFPDDFVPAFQRIHKLPWCFQAFAHQMSLLPYHRQGIFKQSRLIFHCWRAGHDDCSVYESCTMACEAQAAIIDVVGRGSRIENGRC